MYMHVYVCIYIYIYVCMCIAYAYIYIYIYIYMYTPRAGPAADMLPLQGLAALGCAERMWAEQEA